MPDRRGLAVHDPSRAYHAPAVHLADRLVTQAHAQDRDARSERGDQFQRHARLVRRARPRRDHDLLRPQLRDRSEEHTSELQSLMRISYAVFCLKKKKKTNTYQ